MPSSEATISVIDWATLAIALVALFISLWAAISGSRAANRTILGEAFSNYSNRGFTGVAHLNIGTRQISSLREAKTAAMQAYRVDPLAWDIASTLERYPDWQNVVAYETAQSVENFGAAAFVGALPLRLLLPSLADVVIDDWLISKAWVESYRLREQVTATSCDDVHYHRLNGEWLALVAAIWMARKWRYANADRLIEMYGGRADVLKRIGNLRKYRGLAQPLSVRVEVWRLIGVLRPSL